MLERNKELRNATGDEVKTPSLAGTWKRKSVRMITVFLIGYGCVVTVVAVFQRRMLFIPERFPEAIAETRAREAGFVAWRNKAGGIIGWRIPASGVAMGSVLIVHGNAGSAIGRDYIAQPVHAAGGLDVYVMEYPGYGSRGGSPGKDSFFAAGEEAFELLPVDSLRFLVSESLGTGVAGHLAGKYSNDVAGLICLVPYHSLPWVAQKKMPLIPAYVLLRDRFHPAESLRNYRGPLKVVIADQDEVIPPEAGRRLFENYGGPKEFEVIEGAQHNEVSTRPVAWWKEAFAFLEKHRTVKAESPVGAQNRAHQ